MSPVAPPLDPLRQRLVVLSVAAHPLAPGAGAGEAFAAALEAGLPPHEALARAGAPEGVIALLREAAPADVVALLTELVPALGSGDARHRALRSAAVYPLLLALTAGALALLTLGFVEPALLALPLTPHAATTPVPRLPAVLALGASLGMLLVLARAALREEPSFPFVSIRRAHDRTRLLSAAAALARTGTDLPVALRAAAHLAADPETARAARALGAALGRGETAAGAELLGPLGAGIFGAAAAQGGGTAALCALSELAEATTRSELPGALVRAELLALCCGGVAIGAAAIGLLASYVGFLGGLQ